MLFFITSLYTSLNNWRTTDVDDAVWCTGVRVGDWWLTRMECSAAGVHRPTIAGISGRMGDGCYSIALSGGYEDDIDCGEYFTYTGKLTVV